MATKKSLGLKCERFNGVDPNRVTRCVGHAAGEPEEK
jgi:hypothetical protein